MSTKVHTKPVVFVYVHVYVYIYICAHGDHYKRKRAKFVP